MIKLKKMNFIKGLSICTSVVFTMFFAACSNDGDTNSSPSSGDIAITATNVSGTAEGNTNETGVDEDDLVENATFENTVRIVFSDNSVTVTNPVSGDVEIIKNGADITVKSSISKVAYEVSGTTSDGMLKIYSDKKFKLSLSNLSITNGDGPAINIQSKKTIFVVLDGTNSLTDATTYNNTPKDEDAKATFFSEGQLIFSGAGTLSVAGKYKHGISSDDYIRVISGTITVSEAVSDAIHVGDYAIVDGGTLNLSASSDGLDCGEGYIIINDGIFNINVADDGIVASYDIEDESEPDDSIKPNLTINGGTFTIKTAKGEGLEAKGEMTINDGSIDIDAYDDAVNTGNGLYINGGKIYAQSSSNDAIDSNGMITITGGITIALGAREPEGGFDADNNTFKITGGTLLGLGGTTTLPTEDVCTQNSVIFDGISGNTILHIQSSDGAEALTFKMPSSASTILYSSAKLVSNKTYALYSGGKVSDGSNFKGLYSSGTYSGGISTGSSFTVASRVTQIGGQVGPGGPGGGGPGGPGGRP